MMPGLICEELCGMAASSCKEILKLLATKLLEEQRGLINDHCLSKQNLNSV